MPIPRRRLKIVAGCALALGLIGAARTTEAKQLKAFAPELFGMERVAPKLFVERTMPPEQRRALLTALPAAERRVTAFWGASPEAPVVCACATNDCYHGFGYGPHRGHAFAGRVVLSPRGLDAVVMAHEWTHVESSSRSGLLHQLPAWFEEGLAAVASDDPAYTEVEWARLPEAERALPLSGLEALRDFLRAPHGYARGAHEVRRWLSRAGKRGLDELYLAVRSGEPFERAYRRLEAASPASSARATPGR